MKSEDLICRLVYQQREDKHCVCLLLLISSKAIIGPAGNNQQEQVARQKLTHTRRCSLGTHAGRTTATDDEGEVSHVMQEGIEEQVQKKHTDRRQEGREADERSYAYRVGRHRMRRALHSGRNKDGDYSLADTTRSVHTGRWRRVRTQKMSAK